MVLFKCSLVHSFQACFAQPSTSDLFVYLSPCSEQSRHYDLRPSDERAALGAEVAASLYEQYCLFSTPLRAKTAFMQPTPATTQRHRGFMMLYESTTGAATSSLSVSVQHSNTTSHVQQQQQPFRSPPAPLPLSHMSLLHSGRAPHLNHHVPHRYQPYQPFATRVRDVLPSPAQFSPVRQRSIAITKRAISEATQQLDGSLTSTYSRVHHASDSRRSLLSAFACST